MEKSRFKLTGENITYLMEGDGAVVVGNERGGFQSFRRGCNITASDVLTKYPNAKRIETPEEFWDLSNRLIEAYFGSKEK